MQIGKLKGRTVQFGKSKGQPCYRNPKAFQKKTNEICYIPKHGMETTSGGDLDNASIIFKYQDMLRMSRGYVLRNNLADSYEDVAKTLFNECHGMLPSTILENWEMDLQYPS